MYQLTDLHSIAPGAPSISGCPLRSIALCSRVAKMGSWVGRLSLDFDMELKLRKE